MKRYKMQVRKTGFNNQGQLHVCADDEGEWVKFEDADGVVHRMQVGFNEQTVERDDLRSELKLTREALKLGLEIHDEYMSQIANCCSQDYARLNNFPVLARKLGIEFDAETKKAVDCDTENQTNAESSLVREGEAGACET